MKRHLILLLVVILAVSSMLLLVGCESEDVGLDYGTLHDTYESTLELEEYEGDIVLQYNVVNGTTEFTFDESIIELDDSYSFTVEGLDGTSYDDNKVALTEVDNIFIVDIYFHSYSYSTTTSDDGVSTTTETATTENVDTHIINIHVLQTVTVTYLVGDTVYHTESIMEDSLLTAPETDPTDGDNEFVSWVDEEGEEINFKTYRVFGDTEIFASWAENTVTFDLDGGSMSGDSSIIVSNNYVLGEIETPTKDGWVFSGWCDDEGVYFDVENEVIFSDITLIAQWAEFAWSFEILSDDTVAIKYEGDNSGSVVVPTTLNGFVVSELADNAFKDYDGITSITIPEGILELGSMSFANCTSLTSIELPSTVTHVGDYSFMGCTSLVSVTLNEGLTNIGLWAFADCTAMVMIVIPESVTTLENYAFRNCPNLVILGGASKEPSTWQSAWDAYGPVALYWNIGSSATVELIGDAYYVVSTSSSSVTATLIKYVGSDSEFVIPVTITIAGEGDDAEDVEASVTAIAAAAFADCTTLESVTIPYEVTKVGERAFENCTGLSIFVCERSSKAYYWSSDWNISGCEVTWECVYPTTSTEE